MMYSKKIGFAELRFPPGMIERGAFAVKSQHTAQAAFTCHTVFTHQPMQ
jgi:hypothetical protein